MNVGLVSNWFDYERPAKFANFSAFAKYVEGLQPEYRSEKEQTRAFSAAEYAPGKSRDKKHGPASGKVVGVSVLGFDFDGPGSKGTKTGESEEDVRRLLGGLAGDSFFIYSSYSHKNVAPNGRYKFRIVLELSRQLTWAEHERLRPYVASLLAIAPDGSTRDATRLFGLPPKHSEHDFFQIYAGAPLDVDGLLALAPAVTTLGKSPNKTASALPAVELIDRADASRRFKQRSSVKNPEEAFWWGLLVKVAGKERLPNNERHDTSNRLVCRLLQVYPSATDEAIREFFRPTFLSMDAPDFPCEHRLDELVRGIPGARDLNAEQAEAQLPGVASLPAERSDLRASWAQIASEFRRSAKTGEPLASFFNAALALGKHPLFYGVLGHSDFSHRDQIMRAVPEIGIVEGPFPRDVKDTDELMFCHWLQQNIAPISVASTSEAMRVVSQRHIFHPVRDYLATIKHDGINRLDTAAQAYFGVTNATEFANRAVKKTLIAAVARVRDPGCKVDTVLILEGKQGKKKSTAVKALAGNGWFTDDPGDISNPKAVTEQIQGKWLVEMPELDAMSRAQMSTFKTYAARATDRCRLSYGKRAEDFPRQCVVIGTTNDDDYLKDTTGNRRPWPVACGAVDLEAIRRDRDQLWAEAVLRFQAGEQWWFSDEEQHLLAEPEQSARVEEELWLPGIDAYLRQRLLAGAANVTASEVLATLGFDSKDMKSFEAKRVARCLKTLTWERHRLATGARPWVYRPQNLAEARAMAEATLKTTQAEAAARAEATGKFTAAEKLATSKQALSASLAVANAMIK